jgi:nucleotide-binding universal stress UspA family protein
MFERILLLVDSTHASAAAAERAITLASICDAELFVLAVVDTQTLKELLTYKIMVEEEMEEYERDLEDTGRRQIDRVAEQAKDAKVKTSSIHKKGSVHSVVLAQQGQIKADLLVLSGFKPSLVKRDLLAREKQLILDEIGCAVMVVKQAR